MMRTLSNVKIHTLLSTCVVKLTSSTFRSWWWLCYFSIKCVDKSLCCKAHVYCVLQLIIILLYVKTHVWVGAFVAKPISRVSWSWWCLCYVSKRSCQQKFLLPSQQLVWPAAGDDFVICWNACVHKCFCCPADV